MPKTTTVDTTVATWLEQKVEPAVKIPVTYEELLDSDVIPANEMPNQKQILAWVNARRLASERQKEQNKVMSERGFKKPVLGGPTDADKRFTFTNVVKGLLATNMDEATAKQLVNTQLGTNFE